MNKEKLANLLGLAQRAGRIISGEELTVKAIQEGKAHLVFLAQDAAPNLSKKITESSRHHRCWFYKENEVSYVIEEEDKICLK